MTREMREIRGKYMVGQRMYLPYRPAEARTRAPRVLESVAAIGRKLLAAALVACLVMLAAGCNSASPTGSVSEQGAVVEVGGQSFEKNQAGYVDISIEELEALLDEEALPLINVHIPYEGEIPGTDQHLPYDQIASLTEQLPGKEEPFILYCRSGSMSAEAAQRLAAMGYTRILEVDGGMQAWQAAGHELLIEPPAP